MSNYWRLLCRDCDQRSDLSWNRGGDYLQQLIPHMADIAKMEPVMDILSMFFVTFEFPSDLLEFAVRHHSHNLIAVDGYGTLYGDCSRNYLCSCCGSRLDCRRPRDHEGDCGPAAEAAA